MQVNSAQDWLTKKKRRILARSMTTDPPAPSEKSYATFLSAIANGATQRERFVAPFQGAWGGASGGATYSSDCCLSVGTVGAFGVFTVITNHSIVPYTGRSVQPMSVRIVP